MKVMMNNMDFLIAKILNFNDTRIRILYLEDRYVIGIIPNVNPESDLLKIDNIVKVNTDHIISEIDEEYRDVCSMALNNIIVPKLSL